MATKPTLRDSILSAIKESRLLDAPITSGKLADAIAIRLGDREWIGCGWEGHPPDHVHRHDSMDLLGAAVLAVVLDAVKRGALV